MEELLTLERSLCISQDGEYPVKEATPPCTPADPPPLSSPAPDLSSQEEEQERGKAQTDLALDASPSLGEEEEQEVMVDREWEDMEAGPEDQGQGQIGRAHV